MYILVYYLAITLVYLHSVGSDKDLEVTRWGLHVFRCRVVTCYNFGASLCKAVLVRSHWVGRLLRPCLVARIVCMSQLDLIEKILYAHRLVALHALGEQFGMTFSVLHLGDWCNYMVFVCVHAAWFRVNNYTWHIIKVEFLGMCSWWRCQA